MSAAIPPEFRDLADCPPVAALTTLMPDGQPQTTVVWCDFDGECARVNTTAGRQKGRNMAADPRVTLLVVDPDDTSRYIEIRGTAELIEDRDCAHLDAITRQYTAHPSYYGYVYPKAQRGRETRLIARIHATKITLDAIHK